MSATTTVTLELPAHALSDPRDPLQQSMIRHLLYDERITMPEALALLLPEDQAWLVESKPLCYAFGRQLFQAADAHRVP